MSRATARVAVTLIAVGGATGVPRLAVESLSLVAGVSGSRAGYTTWALMNEAIHMLHEGASVQGVDRAFTKAGFPVGAFGCPTKTTRTRGPQRVAAMLAQGLRQRGYRGATTP